MVSVFRLLVYAIAAAALIAVAYAIVFPLLFPSANNITVVENSLKAAETGLGLGFKATIRASQGEGMNAISFDSGSRNVIFQCNSASLCCPQKKPCGLAVEWDSKSVKFNKAVNLVTVSRCGYENSLYTCTIYFGEEPAQLEITELEAGKEFDLRQGRPSFEVSFVNSGNISAKEVEVRADVFQKYLEQGAWKEKIIAGASAMESVGSLAPGEGTVKTLYLNVRENGTFKARVTAIGPEAGFAEKNIEFTVSGAESGCRADYCDRPELSGDECRTRCYCNGCTFGSGCSQKLVEKGSLLLGINENINLGAAPPDLLGSNIVEFSVPMWFCR